MTETRLSFVTAPGLFRCMDVLSDGEEAIRLKRMGICCGRLIRVVQVGDPMVIMAVGARIGVSRQLAGAVVLQNIVAAEHPEFTESPVRQPELCGTPADV